jgi:hypothetical protein
MPRYYFHLRDGAGGVTDSEGTDLPDHAAARRYATQVASELMRWVEVKTRRLDASDDTGKVLLDVPFAAVDTTIDHLSPRTRRRVERVCRTRRELGETMFESRLANAEFLHGAGLGDSAKDRE